MPKDEGYDSNNTHKFFWSSIDDTSQKSGIIPHIIIEVKHIKYYVQVSKVQTKHFQKKKDKCLYLIKCTFKLMHISRALHTCTCVNPHYYWCCISKVVLECTHFLVSTFIWWNYKCIYQSINIIKCTLYIKAKEKLKIF